MQPIFSNVGAWTLDRIIYPRHFLERYAGWSVKRVVGFSVDLTALNLAGDGTLQTTVPLRKLS